jgi:hypothetical protein
MMTIKIQFAVLTAKRERNAQGVPLSTARQDKQSTRARGCQSRRREKAETDEAVRTTRRAHIGSGSEWWG